MLTEWKAFREKHFMAVEFGYSVAITLGVIAFFEFYYGHANLIARLTGKDVLQSMYTTTASITGSMLGFVIAAVAIVISYSQMPRLRILRESGHMKTVFHLFFNAIKILALTTVWAIGGLVFDTKDFPRPWYAYIMLFWMLLSGFRIYRCVWVLRGATEHAV